MFSFKFDFEEGPIESSTPDCFSNIPTILRKQTIELSDAFEVPCPNQALVINSNSVILNVASFQIKVIDNETASQTFDKNLDLIPGRYEGGFRSKYNL